MNMTEPTCPVECVEWSGRTATVDVRGEINLARSVAFQQAVLEVLDESPERIVLDLSGVDYMDSAGVASLVKLLTRGRSGGAELILLRPTPHVRSLLEVTALDRVFDVREQIEEAGD